MVAPTIWSPEQKSDSDRDKYRGRQQSLCCQDTDTMASYTDLSSLLFGFKFFIVFTFCFILQYVFVWFVSPKTPLGEKDKVKGEMWMCQYPKLKAIHI